MTARARDPLDVRQQHGVETPEHVEVRLELAGVGSRTAAMALDLLILFVAGVGLSIVLGVAQVWRQAAGAPASWAMAIVLLVGGSSLLGYFALFEALNGGRTPGKQILGIRVVMDTGRPVTSIAAVVRTLVRLIDCFFPGAPFLPGFFLIAFSKSNKRLGDMAAGTIVIRDRPTDWTLGAVAGPAAEEPIETGPPELTEDEFRLLDRFLARMNELDPAIQVRMTQELVRRFEQRVPRREADAQAYLVQLFAEEQRRRRSRFATRARVGGGAVGRTTVTAERFVARKRDQWEAFYTVAKQAERSGVGALPPREIPAFAARYREVAADLARARTYGVDPRVIEYLDRLVSAGHTALYRARGRRPTPVLHYLLRDFPAAVVESRAYVVAAFLLFAVPAVIGYVMLRERPALADEIVSPIMVSRAEQAAENQARGVGYAQSEDEELPVIAAFIIGNNIKVSFFVFVGGMLAGTLTVWLLVANGLMLGTGMGVFANYSALRYLLTFVAGHGVLELTAIFISAGAGFRLAKALIAPGDRTRKDALVVEGIVAARMIGAVVTLLVIAGTIEGLLSASDADPLWKYGVSASTALFLLCYFANGWKHLKRQGARSSALR
ncbi:MAG: stage II sporulation protein M [Gemmatimonadetes bacterium]|nr:stage II sporulation protein M [Gemmatimonadota bacterium]